ncbi:MAG: tripartite tricarboxylate transporter substrate binding protein [Rubrivivax sp.]
MMHRLLRAALAAAATALAIAAGGAQAQGFPDKPVHLVVPQAPGGASDALARAIGQRLSAKWKQPVVIENRAGAGGNIGMEYVIGQPADGHTLLMTYAGTHSINGALYKNLRFSIERDLVPVASVATLPFVAITHLKAPALSFADMVQLARTQPIHFGSAGNGSVNHLLGEMVNTMAGTRMQHVPYKGAAPALQDLLAGQIQVVFTSLPSVAGLVRGGQVKALAVTSGRRNASFPDIPTIAESGYPGFDVTPWFGIVARTGTPAAVIQKINADVREALSSKEVADQLASLGADALPLPVDEFAALIKADIARWSEAVKSSGARVD